MGYPVLLVALLVGFGDAGKLTYEASQEASGDIACPNGISKCSVGHTCCKLGENWGCCPFTRVSMLPVEWLEIEYYIIDRLCHYQEVDSLDCPFLECFIKQL